MSWVLLAVVVAITVALWAAARQGTKSTGSGDRNTR
jgi:hypothetical protein